MWAQLLRVPGNKLSHATAAPAQPPPSKRLRRLADRSMLRAAARLAAGSNADTPRDAAVAGGLALLQQREEQGVQDASMQRSLRLALALATDHAAASELAEGDGEGASGSGGAAVSQPHTAASPNGTPPTAAGEEAITPWRSRRNRGSWKLPSPTTPSPPHTAAPLHPFAPAALSVALAAEAAALMPPPGGSAGSAGATALRRAGGAAHPALQGLSQLAGLGAWLRQAGQSSIAASALGMLARAGELPHALLPVVKTLLAPPLAQVAPPLPELPEGGGAEAVAASPAWHSPAARAWRAALDAPHTPAAALGVVVAALRRRERVFLMGAGGTGKSVLIRQLVALLATTTAGSQARTSQSSQARTSQSSRGGSDCQAAAAAAAAAMEATAAEADAAGTASIMDELVLLTASSATAARQFSSCGSVSTVHAALGQPSATLAAAMREHLTAEAVVAQAHVDVAAGAAVAAAREREWEDRPTGGRRGARSIDEVLRWLNRAARKHVERMAPAHVRRLQGVLLWVFDEVGMAEAVQQHWNDAVWRAVKGAPAVPFGGVAAVAVGDFCQLAPVVPGLPRGVEPQLIWEDAAWPLWYPTLVRLVGSRRHEGDGVWAGVLERLRTHDGRGGGAAALPPLGTHADTPAQPLPPPGEVFRLLQSRTLTSAEDMAGSLMLHIVPTRREVDAANAAAQQALVAADPTRARAVWSLALRLEERRIVRAPLAGSGRRIPRLLSRAVLDPAAPPPAAHADQLGPWEAAVAAVSRPGQTPETLPPALTQAWRALAPHPPALAEAAATHPQLVGAVLRGSGWAALAREIDASALTAAGGAGSAAGRTRAAGVVLVPGMPVRFTQNLSLLAPPGGVALINGSRGVLLGTVVPGPDTPADWTALEASVLAARSTQLARARAEARAARRPVTSVELPTTKAQDCLAWCAAAGEAAAAGRPLPPPPTPLRATVPPVYDTLPLVQVAGRPLLVLPVVHTHSLRMVELEEEEGEAAAGAATGGSGSGSGSGSGHGPTSRAAPRYQQVVAALTALPLQAAAAATVHSLQGATVEEAVVGLGGTFGASQGYVALSRLRSSAKLHLLPGWTQACFWPAAAALAFEEAAQALVPPASPMTMAEVVALAWRRRVARVALQITL